MFLATRIRKLIRILSVPAFRRGLRQKVAATVEHARALAPLRVGMVIDAGANHGQFALLARHLWPTAEIVSFEPMPAAAERFKALFAGDRGVRLIPLALGTETGEADFHLSRRADSSSLLAITGRQTAMFPGTEEAATTTVRIARLESCLSPADLVTPVLLKIDVQGAELAVLEGAGALLDHIDHVYCECSFIELYAGQALADQVIRFLDARGLVLEGVHNLVQDRNGRAVQGDFLFGRRAPAGRTG
jgi:FkbM family methyltransferase